MSIIHSYLFLYMDQLGASKTLMGYSLAVATLSEIPIFFYADRLLQRWGGAWDLADGTRLPSCAGLCLCDDARHVVDLADQPAARADLLGHVVSQRGVRQ